MDEEKVIHASDITDCTECPLYDHDCCGGWSSSGCGTPIEPPCCSWSGNEEIYEGMYDRDYRDYEYAEVSYKEKQAREQEAREKSRKEDIERRIRNYSDYDNVKVKHEGRAYERWFCPRCHNWFQNAWWECTMVDGVTFTRCKICYAKLAHSYELD